jgi:hypothetical protein
MTSEINVLLEKLQEAIDEAISDSSRIGDIVAEMKRAGHELCLIVETSATISPIATSPNGDLQPPAFVPDGQLASGGEIQLTGEDLAFLQEMNIAV